MISIVVPAYNEEKSLSLCLDSLVTMKTQEKFEVIIVDNDSTDSTGQVALSYQNKLPIKVIIEKQKGRGAARAAGFNKAQGAIIFSTDADTIVPKDWIDTMLRYFNNKTEIVAVTGLCTFSGCCNRLSTMLPVFHYLYKILFGHYWLTGFNFAIRKDAYQRVGGFHRNLNAQEDIELGFRVAKMGKIAYAANSRVITSGRRFQKGILHTMFEYMHSFVNMKRQKETHLSDTRIWHGNNIKK